MSTFLTARAPAPTRHGPRAPGALGRTRGTGGTGGTDGGTDGRDAVVGEAANSPRARPFRPAMRRLPHSTAAPAPRGPRPGLRADFASYGARAGHVTPEAAACGGSFRMPGRLRRRRPAPARQGPGRRTSARCTLHHIAPMCDAGVVSIDPRPLQVVHLKGRPTDPSGGLAARDRPAVDLT